MNILRSCAMLALLATGGAILAACGSGGGSGDLGAAKETTEKPIELVFHAGQSNWTEDMFWALYGNPIKKKFPHITPKFIQVSGSKITLGDLIAAGDQIDLMLVTTSGTADNILKYGLEYDISGLIKESKFDLNRFDPSIVNMQRDIAKGGMYGLPVFVQIPFMLYNRDLFDKFAVGYPKMGMTWDETYDLAVKMSRTEGGKKYYGLGTNMTFHFKTSQIPLSLVDPATNKARSDDKTKRVFDNFVRFFKIPSYEANAAMSKGGELENMFFKDQTLAMYPHFTNVSRRLPDNLNWDAVSLPYYSDAKGVAPAADPYFLYIMGNSKYKKQAFEVSAYLTTVESQIELAKEGFTPVIKDKAVQDAFGKNNKNYAGKNVSAFFPEKLAPAPSYSRFYTLADSSLLNAFSSVVLGAKDMNTALRDYEQEANKKIEEQMAMSK
ncbi:extracellular solute-binding protein [Paenibacillus hemerocallicola]|uniref:Extracellular solute-binding protein n=1 Tax=Paenibacillus hemerocallicola TaxID=1172614 RepID=A0A5C4T573_9BACL|nr:extracellular solute-binding protein [Paenibacillus hemerocallicola]TNJ64224.1 extracellular solute-binding protein [Paenibacillus hemerocallicola]